MNVSRVEFLLNDKPVRVENPPPQMTLLDFIRACGLTGAKEGCAEGECGACAVALVEADGQAGRSLFRVVNSCLMFLPMAANREVLTVEALADNGTLGAAQEAMAAGGGSQCGYCTPGFVISLFAEYYRPDRRGRCEKMALSGNLCRCTGYRPIREAAESLGPAPQDRFRDRLGRPAPALASVSTPGFSRPTSLEGCLSLLRAHPASKLVAGATDLGVESNLFFRRWPHLISLDAVDALKEFSDTSTSINIGAGLPLSEIGRQWTGAPAFFDEWLTLFASPLIRNRATMGGNLATASPIGDAAPLLLALDAVIHIASLERRRAVPISAFFSGYRKAAIASDEIVTSIEIPKPLPQTVRFYKISKRPLDDISTVAAAMALDTDAAGRARRARFAFGGVAATPIRVNDAERLVEGQPWNDAAVERVQDVLARSLHPMSDHRGSAEYRLEVSKSLVEKFHWDERP
jgi:xanthine dehydrogenase small subunit